MPALGELATGTASTPHDTDDEGSGTWTHPIVERRRARRQARGRNRSRIAIDRGTCRSHARFGPLAAAIAFATGIVLAPALDRLGVDPWLRWTLAAALATSARRHPAVLLAAVIAARRRARRPSRTSSCPAGVIADDRIVDRLVGVVRGPVVRTAHGAGAERRHRRGCVWVWSEQPLTPGERIAVTGRASAARAGSAAPGAGPSTTGCERDGAARSTRLGDAPGLRDRDLAVGRGRRRRGGRRRSTTRAAIRPGAPRCAGIAIGDRSDVPPASTIAGARSASTTCSRSAASTSRWSPGSCSRCCAGSSPRRRGAGACIRRGGPRRLPLALAIAYTLVTGAQLATVRALIVVALMLVGAMLDRPLRLVDALGVGRGRRSSRGARRISSDPSFQLSFVAALTLALRPASATRGDPAAGSCAGSRASLWIAITTAPITAFHFQQVAAGGDRRQPRPDAARRAGRAAARARRASCSARSARRSSRLATWLVTRVDRGGRCSRASRRSATIAVASADRRSRCSSCCRCGSPRGRGARAPRLAARLWLALCAAWCARARSAAAGCAAGDVPRRRPGRRRARSSCPTARCGSSTRAASRARASSRGARAPGDGDRRARSRVYGHARIDLAIVSHPHPDHYLGFAALDVPIARAVVRGGARPVRRARRAWPADVVCRASPTLSPDEAPCSTIRRSVSRAAEAGVELVVWAPRYHATEGAPAIEAADPVRTVNDNSLVVELRYRGRAIAVRRRRRGRGRGRARRRRARPRRRRQGPAPRQPDLVVGGVRRRHPPELAVISCGSRQRVRVPVARGRRRAGMRAGAEVARTDLDGAITVVIDQQVTARGPFQRPRAVTAGGVCGSIARW